MSDIQVPDSTFCVCSFQNLIFQLLQLILLSSKYPWNLTLCNGLYRLNQKSGIIFKSPFPCSCLFSLFFRQRITYINIFTLPSPLSGSLHTFLPHLCQKILSTWVYSDSPLSVCMFCLSFCLFVCLFFKKTKYFENDWQRMEVSCRFCSKLLKTLRGIHVHFSALCLLYNDVLLRYY